MTNAQDQCSVEAWYTLYVRRSPHIGGKDTCKGAGAETAEGTAAQSDREGGRLSVAEIVNDEAKVIIFMFSRSKPETNNLTNEYSKYDQCVHLENRQ